MWRSSDPFAEPGPQLSRRRLCLGIGAAAMLMAPVGRAFGQPLTLAMGAVSPTIGSIRVRNVVIDHTIDQPRVAPYLAGRCGLQLGGIHLRAHVDLEIAGPSKPAWFGNLAFVQNVDFHHKRTPPGVAAGNPQLHWACADSHVPVQAPWELDGQYPYNNVRRRCARGLNTIDLDDAPGVFAEIPPAEFERVQVQPGDRFQTFLIWEITADNRPPSAAKPVERVVLGRGDWVWKGSATDIASRQAQCVSKPAPPNGWNLDSGDAAIQRVLIGRAAMIPPPPAKIGGPVYKPVANPNVWVRC